MIRKIALRPGVFLDNTALASEGGFQASQWVRFRRTGPEDAALAESMPGWEAVTGDSFEGIARGAHAWLGRTGQPLLVWGTHDTVTAYVGGEMRDITPKWAEVFLTDPFSTVTGTPTVTVLWNVFDPDSNTSTVAPHGLKTGDTFNASHSDAIGGITVNGAYTVESITDPTRFTITHGSNASSTATMSGAAKVWATVDFKAGLVDGVGGLGYGTGQYGIGPYGLPSIGDYEPRINSFDSLGDRLYYVPRGGPLFAFQPENQYAELIFGGDFASSTGWGTGTGWTISGGVATATSGTASNLSQSIVDTFEGGKVYRVTLTVTCSAGAGFIGINAGSPPAVVRLSPDIVKSGTYTFVIQSPADPLDIVFSKDSTFAGTVDDWSVTIEPKLYRILEAPIASDSMFVDQRGIIFLCSTFQVDGVFNPTCARSSGVDNDREWVPDNDNVASEYILTKGGRVVGGRASRGNVALWTDDGFYTGPYTATAGQAYNFDLAGTGDGLISPLAVCEVGAFIFWVAPGGKMWTVAYDLQGSRPVPIECPGQRYITNALAPAQNDKIFLTANVEHNEVWFHYPSSGDDGLNLEVDRVAVLSVANGAWSFSGLDRTAAVKSGVFQYPIMFGTDGYFYYHEKGETANGATLETWIESAPFGVEDADRLVAVTRFIPDILDQSGNITLQLSWQGWPRSAWVNIPSRTITPTTQSVPVRIMGRRLKFRLTGQQWRLGALSLDVIPTKAGR